MTTVIVRALLVLGVAAVLVFGAYSVADPPLGHSSVGGIGAVSVIPDLWLSFDVFGVLVPASAALLVFAIRRGAAGPALLWGHSLVSFALIAAVVVAGIRVQQAYAGGFQLTGQSMAEVEAVWAAQMAVFERSADTQLFAVLTQCLLFAHAAYVASAPRRLRL